jgi:hypothetical protein
VTIRTKLAALAGLKTGPGDGLGEREFTSYASTWTGTPDSYGGVVAKGASAQTITDWKASGSTQDTSVLAVKSASLRITAPGTWGVLGAVVRKQIAADGCLVLAPWGRTR